MLDFQTKVDIRRHLRVPFAGYPTSGYYGGIRTVLTVGQLESYMNNLQAEEEATLTGNPYGAIRLFGIPSVGDVLTAVVNGKSASYTVQVSDTQNPVIQLQPITPLDAVSFNFATAINAAALGVQAAGGLNFKASPPVTLPSASQVTMSASGQTFTLTSNTTSTTMTVQVVANGSFYPSPKLPTLVEGVQTTVYGYVPICNALESQVGDNSSYLSTWMTKADVVSFRPDQLAARVQTYRWWCKQMGVALSVGPAPAGEAGMGSGFGTKVTV